MMRALPPRTPRGPSNPAERSVTMTAIQTMPTFVRVQAKRATR